MSHPRSLRSTDDRGVSTAVTHVLALGITAILISGLLLASAGLLSDQRRNAANQQLGTIGNRLATQLMKADETIDANADGVKDRVTIRVEQPSRVAGRTYTVRFETGVCDEFDAQQPVEGNQNTNACLTLQHTVVPDGEFQVPLEVDEEVIAGAVDVTFRQAGSGDFRIIVEET